MVEGGQWVTRSALPPLSRLCLYQLDLTSDAKITLTDGTPFPIHKNLLAKHSSFFKSMFEFHPDKKEHRLEMVSSDSMEQILKWMYCRKMKLTDENVPDILKTAHNLDCPEVVQQCSDYLLQRLEPENVIGFWNYAENHQIKELADKVMRYLTYHFPNVVKEEEFLELTAENLITILKSNDPNMDEESVFHAMMTWVEHDKEKRVIHLADLMKCLRFGCFTADFSRVIFGHPLVQEACTGDQCVQLLLNDSMPRAPQDLILAIDGESQDGEYLDTIESFDYRANKWTVKDFKDPCGPRECMGAAVIGTKLFLVGGYNGHWLNSGCMLDLATGESKRIAPMKSARVGLCLETYGGKLYAVGGSEPDIPGHLNTMEQYSPEDNQWTEQPSMRRNRWSAASAVHKDKLYVVGGGVDEGKSAEAYNFRTNTWSFLPDMTQRRFSASCAFLNNMLFVLGGDKSLDGVNQHTSCEAYNFTTNTWTKMFDMDFPRSDFPCWIFEGKILACGGRIGDRATDTVEEVSEADVNRRFRSKMNVRRRGHKLVVVKGLSHSLDKQWRS